MRVRSACVAILLAVGMTACSRHHDRDGRRDQRADDTVAREAGRAAYHAAQGARKAAAAAGRTLDRAGHDAKQGWDDASREHKSRRSE